MRATESTGPAAPTEGARRGVDPRLYQIVALSALLLYGMTVLHFDVRPAAAALILAAAILTQLLCTRSFGLPRFDARSALISGLSLCLLLRSNSALLLGAGAVLAIASKFLLRWHGKHLFNPTNFGIAALLATGSAVWVTPGQWGTAAILAFVLACLGGMVVHRALRSDVTCAFLAVYVALLFARSAWLGEPLAIPLHRLESGSLLLFAFFMISDPKTTPDSRAGRILFGAAVAAAGWYIQFRLFRTNGLLWALAAASPLVPLLDRLLPGRRYEWSAPTRGDRCRGQGGEKIQVRRKERGPGHPVLAFASRALAARGGHAAPKRVEQNNRREVRR